MAKEGSVAPKERVNITYKPATGDMKEEVELPLRMLALGDYTGKPDPRSIEERKPISVDKDNFDDVMAEQNLSLDLAVKNELTGEGEMPVHLEIKSLKDFAPEGIAKQVPELATLLELRKALTALKGPLGNIPAFRRKLQALLADDAARDRLMSELGLATSNGDSGSTEGAQ